MKFNRFASITAALFLGAIVPATLLNCSGGLIWVEYNVPLTVGEIDPDAPTCTVPGTGMVYPRSEKIETSKAVVEQQCPGSSVNGHKDLDCQGVINACLRATAWATSIGFINVICNKDEVEQVSTAKELQINGPHSKKALNWPNPIPLGISGGMINDFDASIIFQDAGALDASYQGLECMPPPPAVCTAKITQVGTGEDRLAECLNCEANMDPTAGCCTVLATATQVDPSDTADVENCWEDNATSEGSGDGPIMCPVPKPGTASANFAACMEAHCQAACGSPQITEDAGAPFHKHPER